MPTRGFVANRIFDEYSLSRLFPGLDRNVEDQLERTLARVAKDYDHLSTVRLAYAGKAIIGATKNKFEGSLLRNGIVIQSPFLDERFRRFVSIIPESYIRPKEKYKRRPIGKYAFVEMALRYKLVPEEIVLQKKASPVTAPIDYWYMQELRTFVLDRIEACPAKHDREYVERILKPKKLEEAMRKRMLGRYTMQPISMLLTYSSYFKRE
jgi:hypothetical protein